MSDSAASVEIVEDVSLPEPSISPVVINDFNMWKFSSVNVKAIAGWPSSASIESSFALIKKDSSGNKWKCFGSAEYNVFNPSFAMTLHSIRLGLTRYITKDCFVSMSHSLKSGANVMVSLPVVILPVSLQPKKGLVAANLFTEISTNQGLSVGSIFRVDGSENGHSSSTQITFFQNGALKVQYKYFIGSDWLFGNLLFGLNVDSRGSSKVLLHYSFG